MVNSMLCSTRYAAGMLPLCHFGTPQTLAVRLVFALLHAKSNYSHTSTKRVRKSNYSRTYAKQGGWGWDTHIVTYLKMSARRHFWLGLVWRFEGYAERRKRAARLRSVGCGAMTCGWVLRRASG